MSERTDDQKTTRDDESEETPGGAGAGGADTGEGASTADSHGGDDAPSSAAEAQGDEEVSEEMKRIEEDPPKNLEDWPQGKAKYETFGGPEGEHGYHEGPEQNLGPSSLRHHEDGEVSIAGEQVGDASEYKGDPIPGGPTDPNTSVQRGERDQEKKEKN